MSKQLSLVPAILLSSAILAGFLVSPGHAGTNRVAKGTFGLGIILGEPTGVSAKLYLSDDTAVDAAIGSAFVGRGLHVHADFLWHPWLLSANARSFVLPVYLGVGGRILRHNRSNGNPDDSHLGVRGVGGVVFDFVHAPIDVFIEIAAVLDFRSGAGDHDGAALDINGGAGVRYYF